MECPRCGARLTLLSREELFELNEYLRKRIGTYEDWLRKRQTDREIEKEALKTASRDERNK
jgi:hypothetical protein